MDLRAIPHVRRSGCDGRAGIAAATILALLACCSLGAAADTSDPVPLSIEGYAGRAAHPLSRRP
jgi:hypothetical protein